MQKAKGTRPAGCRNNADTKAALRLPSLSAFLASSRMACQKRVAVFVAFQTAVRFCQPGVARLLVALAHIGSARKKRAAPEWGQPSGRFAAFTSALASWGSVRVPAKCRANYPKRRRSKPSPLGCSGPVFAKMVTGSDWALTRPSVDRGATIPRVSETDTHSQFTNALSRRVEKVSKPWRCSYLTWQAPQGGAGAMSEPEWDPDAEPKWPDRTWAVLTILAVGAAILSALWL